MDSRKGCPYEVRGLKFVRIFERRTKFAPTVCKTSFFEDFMPLSRHRCVEVAAPYKIRDNKIEQISRADGIRPYMIVLICNIMMAVCHRYLYLQTPIYQVDLTICFCTLNSILLYIIEKGTCFCKCLFLAQKERLELSRRFPDLRP